MKLLELANKIERLFSVGELNDLFFRLNIDYNDLPGETRKDKVRELVQYCDRHSRLSELVNQCKLLRPKESWELDIWKSTQFPPPDPPPDGTQSIFARFRLTGMITIVLLIIALFYFTQIRRIDTPTATPTTPPTISATSSGIPTITSSVLPENVIVFECNVVNEIPFSECAALVSLYASTNGDNWNERIGWLENSTPCAWFGISCGVVEEGNHVLGITLVDNNMIGALPAELGNLSQLSLLDLNTNCLGGTLPKELGKLSNLRTLLLYMNCLEGGIPDSFAGLTSLVTLHLGNNKLSGTLPEFIGNYANLNQLSLPNNLFTGPLPQSLFELDNINKIWLYNNLLTGQIPPEIGQLDTLAYLRLNSNCFEGSIPSEIGQLTNLIDLWLDDNNLSGDIPEDLRNLTNLDTDREPESGEVFRRFRLHFNDLDYADVSTELASYLTERHDTDDEGNVIWNDEYYWGVSSRYRNACS